VKRNKGLDLESADVKVTVCLLVVLVLVVGLLVVDLEVSQLVGVLGGGNNSQPIPEVVLLQVLLGQVLQIPLGEWDVGGQVDLSLSPLEGQVIAEVTDLASDLNPLLQILLEIGAVHDSILDGVGAVDHELNLVLLTKLLNPLALSLQGLLSGCFLGNHLLSLEVKQAPESVKTYHSDNVMEKPSIMLSLINSPSGRFCTVYKKAIRIFSVFRS